MKRIVLAAALALACGGPEPKPPAYSGEVAPGGSVSLRELVASAAGAASVTWSVEPGGGSITSAGVYTAPSCAVVLAALPIGTDVPKTGLITGTEYVSATWSGGSAQIAITVAEKVNGIEVTPTSVNAEPGQSGIQFRATVHYTCHDQNT